MNLELLKKVLEETEKQIKKDQNKQSTQIEKEQCFISNQPTEIVEVIEEKIETKEVEKFKAITEFVGSTIGDTVGLVIANLDSQLREKIGLDKKYSAIGFISARTGGAPHIWAADDAVKETNTEVVSIQLARDCKEGAGQGATIIFAAQDVSDVRRAVEIVLSSVDKHMGDVFMTDAGHIEFHYTSRASYALNKIFNAEVGKSFGIVVGGPAAIGLVMADAALKAASVDLVNYLDVNSTGYSNQIIITVTGDSGAVKQSVMAAREVGKNVFRSMGHEPIALGKATF
ncbi:propanediol utilization microcompartment protein PduB [Vagococcus sp.]|uniref:propanediol utilization microcompartment protein PduB n=1 Tax=Vagococcus sp. TaxID=1933889 RepID=UPI003F9E13E3